jgi:hypothetical protein
MKNNFVVYTALFGDYDKLIEPLEKYEGCDFICFTDQKNLKSNIWNIKIIKDIDLLLNMMNRRYKLLPHLFLEDYVYSLYIDANIILKSNPLVLCEKYLKQTNFLVPKHIMRDCVYKEAKACVSLGKTELKNTFNQMQIYSKENFPKNYGLGENNIIFRKHNENKIINIMNDWWNELNNNTQRDQLSLGYALWKNNKQFAYIKESARVENSYFSFNHHKNEISITLFQKVKKIIRFRYYSVVTSVYWKFL